MQYIRRFFVLLFIIILNNVAYSNTSNKILIISSYGTDYHWSNAIIDEINVQVKNIYKDIDIDTEYLSSERFINTSNWENRIETLLEQYEKDNIKAIVLISDEAWMAYRKVKNQTFKNTPLILCAVKPHSISIEDYNNNYQTLSLDQFSETLDVMKEYNATAVIREVNIPGHIDIMSKVMPNIDRFTLITDNRFYGIYTKLMFEKEVNARYCNYQVEFIDARFVNTDSLLSRLPLITENTGVLLTSWLTGKGGFTYSKKYVYKEMINRMKTPVFITTDIGFDQGWFIGGCFNNASFWGKEAGKMIIEVLKGQSPIDIAPLMFMDEQANINLAVLSKFNLSKRNLPKGTNYINDFDPIFVQYKAYIITALCVFIIIITCAIYILKSNIRLKKAQKQARLSMEEVDVTNQNLQKTKEELIVALNKAKEADRLKSSFVANMGAQIRNPLNAIIGFSGLMSTMENRQEREETAILIKQNSDTLFHLITSILDISQLESKSVTFNKEETDLNGLCADMITGYRSSCPPNINITLSIPTHSIVIITDGRRLVQVLSNLLDNAIKFTNSGTIDVGYFVCDDNKIEFYVQDNGTGIPSDKLDVIFDSFVKINSYIAGAGLGLTIVKNIVEIFGGEIGVDSKLNEGSRFWFRITKQ